MFEFEGGSPDRYFEGANSDEESTADPGDPMPVSLADADESGQGEDPYADPNILPTEDRVPPAQTTEE
jgi:hypothetical protein